MTNVLCVLGILIIGILGVQPSCLCRVADDDQRPHGANVYEERRAVTMFELRGELIGPDDSPAGDAIVEVYVIPENQAKFDHTDYERLTARLTDDNGRFCVPELAPGRYFVAAGVQESGVNMVHVVVEIRPDAKQSVAFLSLPLTMGS